MRICILVPRFPFPENGGDVLRINAIARYLKKQNHELVLCSFCNKNLSEKNLQEARKLYDEIHTVKYNRLTSVFYMFIYFITNRPIQCGYYYSHKFMHLFKKVINENKCDLYVSHLLRMTPYLDKNELNNKSIIEMTDALSKTYSLSNKMGKISIKAIVYALEKRRIKKYEKQVISEYKKVVLVSKSDIEYLGNQKTLAFHTNGINCIEHFVEPITNKICFVGNMRTLQNQDAVKRFIIDIFPTLREKYPNLQFHIVGAEPPIFIQNLADNKSIFVTGFVDSVEDYIKDSNIIVAPVNIAAGIQNKVLIGMACKVPVVLSSLIAKSIPELENGINCFIADSSEDFIEYCIELLSNSEKRNQIAENGYYMVRDNYSWDAKLAGFEILSN